MTRGRMRWTWWFKENSAAGCLLIYDARQTRHQKKKYSPASWPPLLMCHQGRLRKLDVTLPSYRNSDMRSRPPEQISTRWCTPIWFFLNAENREGCPSCCCGGTKGLTQLKSQSKRGQRGRARRNMLLTMVLWLKMVAHACPVDWMLISAEGISREAVISLIIFFTRSSSLCS